MTNIGDKTVDNSGPDKGKNNFKTWPFMADRSLDTWLGLDY